MSVFLEACRSKETDYTPVWFMRQTGRYLPEYSKIKGKLDIMDLLKHPEVCSELTILPVRKLGVDAAIIFADIMLPLESMGVRFKIEEGVGPVIFNPIKTLDDVEQLNGLSPEEDLGYLWDSIRLTVEKLGETPLIGFSGGPFTLATYLVEGRPTRDFTKTKVMMYGYPEIWNRLMTKLSRAVQTYLQAQVKYGVKAIQLFDSWAGCLSKEDYERYVLGYTKEVFGSLSGYSIPKIAFCAESFHLLEAFKYLGADVISVDWRTPIWAVWKRCGDTFAVQGNLDPSLAVVGGEALKKGALDVLEQARGHLGHIFNLGHGVLKDTPVENLKELVSLVHNNSKRGVR
ncbi:MAG: uroporphyrinogen decarboxylase [Conexivisphaerales archaeon]